MPDLPVIWERSPAFVYFKKKAGEQEPDFTRGVPRLAVDVRMQADEPVEVAYGFGRATNALQYDGYRIQKLPGNRPSFEVGAGASTLTLVYHITREIENDASRIVIFTPGRISERVVPPTGWERPNASTSHVYDGDGALPNLRGNAVRFCFEVMPAGERLKVVFGARAVSNHNKLYTMPYENPADEKADEEERSYGVRGDTARLVVRVFRATVPALSVSLLTPGD